MTDQELNCLDLHIVKCCYADPLLALFGGIYCRIVSLFVCLSQAKEKYEKSLEELSKCTPQYMECMEQVFDQCQQHEVKRLTFLKEALLDIKRHLNLTENQKSVKSKV